jgi:ketosteroid isomerase-like protein
VWLKRGLRRYGMSEKLEQLISAGLDAWNRQDLDDWLALLAPEVELWTSGAFPDFDPVYRGQPGAVEFWRKLHDPWDTLILDLDVLEPYGGWLAYAFRFRAKGVGSGVEVDLRFANAARVIDGRMDRIVTRRTLEEARDVAVGRKPNGSR